MTDNLVTVSFEIEEELYNEAAKVCTELGTTIEQVCAEFLRFFANPDNLPKVKKIALQVKKKERFFREKYPEECKSPGIDWLE